MRFWMVHIIGSGLGPIVRHKTYNAAYTELKRLSALTKKTGYILEAVAESQYTPPTPPEGVVTINTL